MASVTVRSFVGSYCGTALVRSGWSRLKSNPYRANSLKILSCCRCYSSTGSQTKLELPRNHPIISRLSSYSPDKTAIRHVASGNHYSYGDLIYDIAFWRAKLQRLIRGLNWPGKNSIGFTGIAIMGENSYQFTVPFFAALSIPGIYAIPLCTNHTQAEIEYQLDDSQVSVIITQERFFDKVQPFASKNRLVVVYEEFQQSKETSKKIQGPSRLEITETPSNIPQDFTNTGYILYTSGTSGKPKGVVTPLETFVAQADALIAAWDIDSSTNFLQTLPLHHVHGVVIAMTLSLFQGGSIEYSFPFSAKAVLNRFKPNPDISPINTWSAVPTIYTRIVAEFQQMPETEQAQVIEGIKSLRLAMCGSAALPTPLRDSWEAITKGDVPLLERYGMTETGITLSQPLDPSLRKDGSVGGPVPTVVARLVDVDTHKELYRSSDPFRPVTGDPVTGEVQLSGPTVFKEYLNKPQATAESFVTDPDDNSRHWFLTGDIAKVDKDGNFYMQGRSSMDIIKSGGEKISALEIEREILGLDQVAECAVVGVDSEEWGQVVTAVVVLKTGLEKDDFTTDYLKQKLKKNLAGWKIPKHVLVIDKIPRNQMGKVNKKSLVKALFP